ncbi:MAG: tetratricopeptide repeat protein [Acidobacteria bacterium]|nr:tetratricopeptide repeat protein [Acidobacteriota bacterium]
MPRPRIDPGQITRPTQLAAAWFVVMLVLVTTFIAGAALIPKPSWVAPLLVIAAVVTVPSFATVVFLLQTKYRRELQHDAIYARSTRASVPIEEQAAQLKKLLRDAGLDLRNLSRGRSLDERSLDLQEQVVELSTIIQHRIEALKSEASPVSEPAHAAAEFSVAKALMAEGRWTRAAEHFQAYLSRSPHDWEAWFSMGYCHGKSRLGQVSDLAALQAYDRAVALSPANLEPNIRARLITYRAAIKKRLGRLEEAEREFTKAQVMAREPEEIQDIQYHLASIYAMTGRPEEAIALVRELRNTPYIASVWSHLGDYFHAIADLPAFRDAVGEMVGNPDDPEQRARLLRLRAAR